jgi:hypothetical protein
MTFTSDTRTIPFTSTLKIRSYKCDRINCSCTLNIKKTNSIKYLGIVVDCHLRWDHHINSCVKKIRKYTYLFRTLRHILDLKSLKIVYYSFIQSTLGYGLLVWGGAPAVHMRKLIIAQKLILKIIFAKPYLYPSDSLFVDAAVFNIPKLYFISISKFIFKNRAGLSDILEFPQHNYGTRCNTLKTSYNAQMKKKVGQSNFIYFAAKVYNNLLLNFLGDTIFNYSRNTYLKHIKKYAVRLTSENLSLLFE